MENFPVPFWAMLIGQRLQTVKKPCAFETSSRELGTLCNFVVMLVRNRVHAVVEKRW